jgi:hypothetical protein
MSDSAPSTCRGIGDDMPTQATENRAKPNRTAATLRESAVNNHRKTKATACVLDSTHSPCGEDGYY